MSNLREIVFSNMNAALENGYIFDREMTAAEHAHELICYAADCEDFTADQLEPYCVAWLRSHAIG